MREFNTFHTAAINGSADPLLHGVARGLALRCPVPIHDDLPDDLDALLARVMAAVDDDDECRSSRA